MADTSSNSIMGAAKRMCSIPEKFQLHLAMLALQFGYAGFHVVSRAALNMGISKIVFPVYRNILALLLLLPFAYFLEKYVLFFFRVCMVYNIYVYTIISLNSLVQLIICRKERPPLTWSFMLQFFLLAIVGYVITFSYIYIYK